MSESGYHCIMLVSLFLLSVIVLVNTCFIFYSTYVCPWSCLQLMPMTKKWRSLLLSSWLEDTKSLCKLCARTHFQLCRVQSLLLCAGTCLHGKIFTSATCIHDILEWPSFANCKCGGCCQIRRWCVSTPAAAIQSYSLYICFSWKHVLTLYIKST
jgi:hypothetical protein